MKYESRNINVWLIASRLGRRMGQRNHRRTV